MNVRDHMTLEKLEALEKREPDAYLAKRIRTIILSIKGYTASDVERALGVPYRTVQVWVELYNKEGSIIFKERRGGDHRETFTAEQSAQLKKRIDDGPKAEDNVCTLRGVDVQRILAQEFGVLRSLPTIYVLLHKMGYSYLRPRPRHRKADLQAQAKFIEQLPQTLATVAASHPNRRLRIFFQDESRFGQQGSITNVWARRGSRPTAVRQTEYEYLWVLGAVCPETGKAEGLLSPRLNTDVVNIFLKQFSTMVADDEHAVIIWDGAGYHKSKSLQTPENITLLQLPPYSPELNPIENLWHYLKSHYLSNRAYADYEALETAAIESWCHAALNPELMKTVCAATYIKRAGLN
jgi:transposase